MPINNMNPEGLVKEIKIKNKNQAYKRRWKEPLFLDNNKPQVSLENGLFLMPKYSTEETLNEKDDLESQIQNLVQGENEQIPFDIMRARWWKINASCLYTEHL